MKNGDPYRLLLVDDERLILFAMTKYFSSKGFVIDTAESPEQAMALMRATLYDVAIVDLKLSPEADDQGMQVVRALHLHQPGCLLVVLTAFGSEQVRAEARELGVAAFLKKPRRLPDLLALLLGLLQERCTAVASPG